MNWEAIGALGETIGAIAVVATLTYLAVQVRTARVASGSDARYAAVEAFSRWRSGILQNSDVADAVAKANRGEGLTDREELQVRTLTDELFILVVVGATGSEGWTSLDREGVDLEYLRGFLEENPGLLPQWRRYRHVAELVSLEQTLAVDGLVASLGGGN